MKKIVFTTAITLAILLSGCGESAENKAKAEFTSKIFDSSVKPIDFRKNIKKTLKEYEEAYGEKAEVWLEELKRTDEFIVKQKKYNQSLWDKGQGDFSNAK